MSSRFAIGVAVAALLLAGCGASTNADGDANTVRLAFVGPLTGDDSALGVNIRNGARVAVIEAKSEGSNVVLAEYDTGGDPDRAAAVVNDLSNDASVIGVVGPTLNNEAQAALAGLQTRGIVAVSPSASGDAAVNTATDAPVFHRIVTDNRTQGAALADYVVKRLAATGVAYVQSGGSDDLIAATQAAAVAAGVPTAASVTVDPRAQDVSIATAQLQSSGASVVVVHTSMAAAGRIAHQLDDAGSTAQLLVVNESFVNGPGLDAGFLDAAGEGANGVQFACACSLATTGSEGPAGAFARKYVELNSGAVPGSFSAEGYDAANVMINGIREGHTDRAGLLTFVNNYPATAGLTKTIAFASDGNLTGSETELFYVVRDKKIEALA